MAEKKISFEKSMVRLEQIVDLLENGEVSLDDSLKLFEEAAGLIKNTQKLLDRAEQKVKSLSVNADGEVVTEDFSIEDNDD